MIDTAPTIEALDRDLLTQALREMIRRFQFAAKEAGYSDKFIADCTETELALINRVTLAKECEVAATPKYQETSCSNCGCSFGPGDHGFSHCDSHKGKRVVSR